MTQRELRKLFIEGGLILLGLVLFTSCQNTPSPIKTAAAASPKTLAYSEAKPGLYLGYLRLDKQSFKVPMIFDLITASSRNELSTHHVVVKLLAGSFAGNQFHSDFHENVLFNRQDRDLIFAQQSEKIHLSQVKQRGGVIFSGNVSIENNQNIGDFIVLKADAVSGAEFRKHLQQMYPEHKILPEVAANYQGTCGASSKRLFSTNLSRWPNLSSVPSNLLSDYIADVQLTEHTSACKKLGTNHCSTQKYRNLRYSLPTLTLSMKGESTADLNCSITEKGLNCGTCAFTAMTLSPTLDQVIQSATELASSYSRLRQAKTADISYNYAGDLEGDYWGYLIQPNKSRHVVRLKINVEAQKGTKSSEQTPMTISGLSSLFFGVPEQNEFVAYQFNPVQVNRNTQQLIFNGPGESFLEIQQWRQGKVRGLWHSKMHGTLGIISLDRTISPDALAHRQLRGALAGTFNSSQRRVNLLTSPGLSRSEKDFFPLSLRGLITDRSSQQSNFVGQWAYDIRSGEISFKPKHQELLRGKIEQQNLTLTREGLRTLNEVFSFERDPYAQTTARQLSRLFSPE